MYVPRSEVKSSLSNTKDYDYVAVKYGSRTNRCYMQSNCRKHAIIKISRSRTGMILKFSVLENAISWYHAKKAWNGVRWDGGRCKIHGTSVYATRACILARREKRRRVESGMGKKVEKEKVEDKKTEGGKTWDCNNRVHVILNPVAMLSYCDGWYAVFMHRGCLTPECITRNSREEREHGIISTLIHI